MCFVLYAGTSHQIPRKEWRKENPDLSVKSLTDRERPIVKHFSKPHIQYVGSTSQCGCDFPHVMFQSGGWPWLEDNEPERQDSERCNRERLVAMLCKTGDSSVELYGIWDGNFDFNTAPLVSEAIHMEQILDRGFRFKEGGFYIVDCKPAS